MSVGRLIRRLYLCYFSQPAADRAIFKAIRSRPVQSIVEVGIGFGGRTERLLETAAARPNSSPLRYTGIDLFEARTGGAAKTPLKQAYARLRQPSVRVQLVPGEPETALRRVANGLPSTDLLLIAADQDRASLERAWAWVPRMLAPSSLIFLEELDSKTGQRNWRRLSVTEVQQLAKQSAQTQRRAA